jgi:predicted kinase
MRRTANPPTLHFFCGKPGAGKTTLASQLARDHDAMLISEDIWLLRLFGDEMKVFGDYVRVSRRLKAGRSVVLDFQANTQAGRAWFRTVFEQAAAGHVLHLLNTPDATCLERIARRNIEGPEGAHHVTKEVFVQVSSFFQAPEAHEGFNVRTCDARTP